MTTQKSEYQPFFAYLQSLNFHFLETWVIDCINYYKSINPDINFEVLKNEVKQQWLLVNLREIKVPSLPPDLKLKEKIILNGTYAVQVESMIDCSESCYSQFQKLQNINTENIEATNESTTGMEWNTKGNRCLTFVICDGVQEIQAMEYQPIKKIRTNDPELLPGFKMIIVGPVECRKGMILLKDENVRVYGGEVDTLTVSNNLKSLLIKRLELDENDYPDNDCSNPAEDYNEIPQPSSNAPASASNLDEECVESLLSQNDDLFLSLSLETEILAQELKPKNAINASNDVNEIDMFSESTGYWNEGATNQCNDTSNQKKHSLPQDVPISTPKRLSLDPDLEDTETESLKWHSTNQTEVDIDELTGLHEKTCPSALKSKKPVQTKLSSFFKNSDLGSSSVCRTETDSQKPLLVCGKPFVYLRHILSSDLSKADVFMIKGIILTLRKKITIENDEFNLKANVTDGSASVDVDFSSGILEDLLGFSPCEMTVMMKARQANSAIAHRIKESFLRTQEKLISLNCLMKIEFFNDGRTPLILSLEEITAEHLDALKERRLKEILSQSYQ